MQVRAVECQNQAGEIGHNCRGTKPELTAPCNTQPCPSKYYWKYGEWSKVHVLTFRLFIYLVAV